MDQIPLYIFIFIALYSQVFLFLVLFEKWDTIFASNKQRKLKHYPTVVIAVPCWNESKTVEKTLVSLLNLDYPKDKLKIWAVDDGSSDNTFEILQKCKTEYDTADQLIVKRKENGGKHTVLNYVLENTQSEIFGCLDADSYVFPDTLQNMLFCFEDTQVMAATPMLIVRKPTNMLQAMQTVEYNFGLLVKRILGSINGIHVTPGPFSLFRKEVFDKLGGYRPAHNTEDMEITFRMQKNFMKIVSAVDAYVETSTPPTLYKLYRQRLRWTQGFLQNSIDYRDMIFRPQYGPIALFTIPLGIIGISMVLYLFFLWIYSLVINVHKLFLHIQAVGINLNPLSFNYSNIIQNILSQSYYEMNTIVLLSVPLMLSSFYFMMIGHNLSRPDSRRYRYILYFVFVWGFILPFWFTRAVWNVITNSRGQWR
jgi:cellulose synthase/poly-beta-1,6-N-acetylglucosamine synthase-like glycosyltransferase